MISKNLPTCFITSNMWKNFERLIYNNLFEFFIKNDLIHLINQVLSKVTHVYISFYLLRMKFINRLTTVLKLEVFFLISPKLLINFGTNVLFLIQNKMGWKQRVVLNHQHSKWSNMSTAVTKGPILGRLLFLICINDSSNNLS